MAKQRDLNPGDTLYASVMDALEEHVSAIAENIKLTLNSGTVVQLSASAGSGQAGIGLGGLWRYNTANATATHPGGAAAIYDVLAVGSANTFGTGETDTTDYTFGLQIVASGAGPTGNYNARPITVFRKIAEVRWDGSQITRIRHTLYVPGGSQFHTMSPRTGLDAFTARDSTGVERFRIKEDGSWDIADSGGTFQAGIGLNGTALKATQAFQSAGDITARHAGTTTVTGNVGPASEPGLKFNADATIYRTAAGAIKSDSSLTSTSDITARSGGTTSAIGNFGPTTQPALTLNGDTTWYRLSAGTMRTDGALSVGGSITGGSTITSTGAITAGTGVTVSAGDVTVTGTGKFSALNATLAGTVVFQTRITTDTGPRLSIQGDGSVVWASGAGVTQGTLAGITGGLNLTGTLTVSGTATFSGNATVAGTLGVTSTFSAVAAGSFGGNLTIGGNLTHTGTGVGFFGISPISRVAVRTMTNWTSASNSLRTIDRASWTNQQLFDFVMTGFNDLKLYGLFQ